MDRNITIVYGYLIKHGGIGRYISETLNGLRNRKIEIFALESNVAIPNGVKLHLINCPRNKTFMSSDENEFFSKEVESLTKHRKNQLLHSHGVYSLSPGLYTAHICLNEYFNNIRAIFGESVLRTNFGSAVSLVDIEKRMIDSIASRNNHVVSVSEKVRDELARSYGIIADQVIFGASRFRGKQTTAKKQEEIKKVGFIGNNIYTKGLVFLRESLTRLVQKGFKLGCVSAGTNGEVDSYLGSDAFSYLPLGKIEVGEDFYRDLDCFVCLSPYEAYSLSTLEAMALSVPVVSSRLNGVFYDAAKKGDKIITEVADITDIAETSLLLERVFTDPRFVDRAIEQGKKIVGSHTWEDVSEDYDKLYSN